MGISALKSPEDKLVKAGLLLDVYGDLLTKRQRTFMRLHFDEDLSFSDIAREYEITRQAVHDSVKHAFRTLTELESALGLVEKATAASESQPHIGGRQLVERLEGLRRRVGAECEFEKTSWVVEELTDLIRLLHGESGNAAKDELAS